MRKFCTLLLCFAAPHAEHARAQENQTTLRSRLAWQIALERVAFSPGIIDGRIGPKTQLATREFQRVHGLPQTGRLDAATAAALQTDAASAVATYVVAAEDFAQVCPVPKDWIAKSRLQRLGYESVIAAVAERFHCPMRLLEALNPGCNVSQLHAGDILQVPAVTEEKSVLAEGNHLEINLLEKVVRVMNSKRELLGLFHCSIAKDKANLPVGDARVEVITEDPSYTFDPRMWPEVKGVDRKLLIQPGPRNPVGRCWIGLSLPGYGIHGSPNPELIGKTGSHGCFRLTNWDALRLARMIRVGTKVTFVGTARLARAD